MISTPVDQHTGAKGREPSQELVVRVKGYVEGSRLSEVPQDYGAILTSCKGQSGLEGTEAATGSGGVAQEYPRYVDQEITRKMQRNK